MNRQQALEWLVEHVTKWPCRDFDFTIRPYGWLWINPYGEHKLLQAGTHEKITQQDWLDATDNMERKEDE